MSNSNPAASTAKDATTVTPPAKSSGEIVKEALSRATTPNTMAGLRQTDVGTILNGMKAQIASALPKHLTADRMIQMSATLIANNPTIAQCDFKSLVGAVMQASILGFEPVAALGQCYFVPYGGKVQFQIGYKGYLRLAQNSKELKNLYAEVVRAGDTFEYELGLEPKLRHIPALDSTGAITHVYAVAHMNNGGYQFVVLTRGQVEALRMRSPMQGKGISGAWATDYDEMAKAKAIKKLAKYLPLSVDMQKAIASDEAVITEKAFTNNQTGIDVDSLTFDTYTEVPPAPQEPVIESKGVDTQPTGQTSIPLPAENASGNVSKKGK